MLERVSWSVSQFKLVFTTTQTRLYKLAAVDLTRLVGCYLADGILSAKKLNGLVCVLDISRELNCSDTRAVQRVYFGQLGLWFACRWCLFCRAHVSCRREEVSGKERVRKYGQHILT